MTTYAELVAYFEGFTTTVPAVKFVVVGSDEEIFDSQNSQIRYPSLWVETPDVSFVDSDDAPFTRFDFAVVVLGNEPLKTGKEGNAKLSAMLTVAQDVYGRIQEDALRERLFDLVLKNNAVTPVRQWSGDNCFGWRFEVSLELFRDEIPD